MEIKDWILLLVPIFCNGVVVFTLQRIFEKRQIIKTIKNDYALILRQKIDISLELYVDAIRMANEGKSENDIKISETIQKYVDSVLDIYYYYIQNKVVFEKFDNEMEQIPKLISELRKYKQLKGIQLEKASIIFDEIREELMALKNRCINLQF